MENILIIGNGFDLYHGLPTRYTDFLSFVEFWNHFKEKYNLNSSKSKDESDGFIIRLGENGTIIEESMEDFASYRLCFDSEKIEYLDKYLQKNAWIKYFINTKYKKEGWIDFESEMEKVLLVIDKLTSHTKDYYTNNTAYSLMINEKPSYIECFEEKIEGNGFLLEKINTNKDHLNEYRKELLKCMKNEMEVLNKCLRIYLSEFVSKIKIRVTIQSPGEKSTISTQS